jgi:hypothetical protein
MSTFVLLFNNNQNNIQIIYLLINEILLISNYNLCMLFIDLIPDY